MEKWENEKKEEEEKGEKEWKKEKKNERKTEKTTLLKLEDISKKFGKKKILENINLSIPKGKIFAIVGPSGVGKTTLFRIIATFYKPSSGKIYLQWERLKKLDDKVKLRIGFSAQHGSFYPNLTVDENIRYFGSLYGFNKAIIEKNAYPLLKELELLDYRKTIVGNLSKGIQKRLDIICALVHDPEIVILDEPMEDLDPYLRKKVCNIIKKLKKKGKSIIICSHFFKELEDICDEIVMIFEGKIMVHSSIEKIKKKYGNKTLEEIFLEIMQKRLLEQQKEKIKEKKFRRFFERFARTLRKDFGKKSEKRIEKTHVKQNETLQENSRKK